MISRSSRGQAARETNNGPQRARITETDASRTNCEPPVPRVRLVSLDRTRCLRSAGARCDPQVWVPEVFSNFGGARKSGVGRGDFAVNFASHAWKFQPPRHHLPSLQCLRALTKQTFASRHMNQRNADYAVVGHIDAKVGFGQLDENGGFRRRHKPWARSARHRRFGKGQPSRTDRPLSFTNGLLCVPGTLERGRDTRLAQGPASHTKTPRFHRWFPRSASGPRNANRICFSVSIRAKNTAPTPTISRPSARVTACVPNTLCNGGT